MVNGRMMMDCAETERRSGIDRFLTNEHRKLDKILADVEFLISRNSFVQAAKRFGEFRYGVEKHMVLEDKVLMPLYKERMGSLPDFAGQMSEEHDQLHRLLAETSASISQWDKPLFRRCIKKLSAALDAHHRIEEKVLHPALGSLIRDELELHSLCRKRHVII